MERTHRPHSRTTALLLLSGLMAWSAPAAARSVWGACVMRDGTCYRSLDEEVDPGQAEEYLRTTPSEKPRWITRNLRRGTERWSDSLPLPALPARAATGQAEPAQRFLSIIESPWLSEHYRTFVKVEARFPEQPSGTISVCSGTMVGSHTVLTAGHCIYSQDAGGWAEWVYVYPAMAGYHATPYGEAEGVGLTSTSWWVTDGDHRGDTGIVQLAQNVGDLTGWPALRWDYTSFDGVINSGGYPADEGYDGYWMHIDSGDVEDYSDYLICHSAHTVRGMSGGAGWLYYADTQERFVTAVNSFCYVESGQCCMARYVDLAEQQRQDSESESASGPPDHWTCDLNAYAALDGCECLCGIWDPDCDQTGQAVSGCAIGERCIRPGVCVCDPQCSGLDCGHDGCGGSCGGCQSGSSCQAGICVCNPQCAGKQCGGDLCGGSCGTCPQGSVCQDGACSCVPDCADKICGPDGCGGSCGDCPDGLACQAGACACVPACGENSCGSDGCGGVCGGCAGDQTCVDGLCVCLDNCQGRECGSDGCGGSCGSCMTGEICNDGKCVGEDDLGNGSSCGCDAAAGSSPEATCLLLLLGGLLLFRAGRRD